VEARPAFLGEFAAGFPAGLGFPVKLLGHCGRSADIAQAEDLNLEVSPFGFDREQVPDPNLPRRPRRLVVGHGHDAAQLAGLRREVARFEEARRPQPFVQTRAGHRVMLVDSGTGDAYPGGGFAVRRIAKGRWKCQGEDLANITANEAA
jgi:hypothetical protein